MTVVSRWMAATLVLMVLTAWARRAGAECPGPNPRGNAVLPSEPVPKASPWRRVGKGAAIAGAVVFVLSAALFAEGRAHVKDGDGDSASLYSGLGVLGMATSALVAIPGYMLWQAGSGGSGAQPGSHPQLALRSGPAGTSGASLALSF